jgi:(p)ppGpp synthase/HD superfamily hydrolase
MLLTHRLQYAINEAARLHRDQHRRDTQKTPYITHLIGVMILLSSVTHDEDILIAGLMHDSLEDVPDYTPERLSETFGSRVTDIVLGVTEFHKLHKEKSPSWKEEKDAYLANLRDAADESVLVSLADKIQNTRGYIELLNTEDKDTFSFFRSNHAARVWFHKEVLALGEERLGDDHLLVEELREEIVELEKATAGLL